MPHAILQFFRPQHEESFIHHAVGKCFKGKLDILVNCAAIYWVGPLAEGTGDDLINILNNNVAGYQRTTHYALPYMRHNNETRVISLGSLAGSAVLVGIGGYQISKAANQTWNDVMQLEEMFNKAQGYVEFGPTFSCIEPSVILTSIQLYEWYQARALSPNDPQLQGQHQAFALAQNLDLFSSAVSTVSEAAFRIAVAPQPGVRYTAPEPEDDPLQAAETIRIANTLSQDDAINLIWSPFVTLFQDLLEELKPLLAATYCDGCEQTQATGRDVAMPQAARAKLSEKVNEILENAQKHAHSKARCGATSDN